MRPWLLLATRDGRWLECGSVALTITAKREIMSGVEHRSHKGLNNRAENSHLAVRRRERCMIRFKSACQCQRFVSIHGPIANLSYLHLERALLNIANCETPPWIPGAKSPWRPRHRPAPHRGQSCAPPKLRRRYPSGSSMAKPEILPPVKVRFWTSPSSQLTRV